MKKSRKLVITGAAIASTAALVIGGTVAASAHEGGMGNGEGKAGKSGTLSSLVDAGTISQDEADAIREAMKAGHEGDREAKQAERAAGRDAVLSDLVADGTLTQAQADAISAADKGGMRELIANGTIDREDVQAIKQALRDARADDREAKQAERAAERDAVLDALVADGTLTQSQADAVASAQETAKAEKAETRGEGKRGEGKRGGGMRR